MSARAASVQQLRPASAQEAAQALADAAAAGRTLRVTGRGTKRGWGNVIAEADAELSTAGLDEIVEHNEGDLTAVLGAGVPLARAQETFARAGQMLAVDPPLSAHGGAALGTAVELSQGADGGAALGTAADPTPGADAGATIGGTIATGDSGPYRHRYHALRDLVIGVAVALPDGSVARAGGKVIKNVAGYDLAKLMTGAFGTLGVICEVSLRLHPRPVSTATTRATSDDPMLLTDAANALAQRPLEPLALDLDWEGGEGAVLARFGGRTASEQAADVTRIMREAGLHDAAVVEDDEPLWERQRAGQRAAGEGAVVRVAATPRRLATVLQAGAALGARVVARAAIGSAWLSLPAAEPAQLVEAIEQLRARVAPSPATVLDGPDAVRAALDPWGALDPAAVELMRRVKARFDPQGTCNRGLFMGGI